MHDQLGVAAGADGTIGKHLPGSGVEPVEDFGRQDGDVHEEVYPVFQGCAFRRACLRFARET